jgi:hypothetical protein
MLSMKLVPRNLLFLAITSLLMHMVHCGTFEELSQLAMEDTEDTEDAPLRQPSPQEIVCSNMFRWVHVNC